MNIFELSEYVLVKSIHDKLLPDQLSAWRYICRDYSITFSTPLHLVETLDPEFILTHLHERNLDKRNLDDDEHLNSLLETLNAIEDPEYDAKRNAEEELANELIVRQDAERRRLKELKKKKEAAIKANKEEKPKELPKQGSVNLSYLSNMADKEG